MPREKGSPKTGGRKAGTPNKVTKATKEVLAQFIGDEADNFKEAMHQIYKEDKVTYAALYVKMLPYVIPRLNSVDVNSTNNTKLSMEQQLLDMANE